MHILYYVSQNYVHAEDLIFCMTQKGIQESHPFDHTLPMQYIMCTAHSNSVHADFALLIVTTLTLATVSPAIAKV